MGSIPAEKFCCFAGFRINFGQGFYQRPSEVTIRARRTAGHVPMVSV
jgi:hypothetical protein